MVINAQLLRCFREMDGKILTDYHIYVRIGSIMIKKEQNFREVIYGRCC